MTRIDDKKRLQAQKRQVRKQAKRNASRLIPKEEEPVRGRRNRLHIHKGLETLVNLDAASQEAKQEADLERRSRPPPNLQSAPRKRWREEQDEQKEAKRAEEVSEPAFIVEEACAPLTAWAMVKNDLFGTDEQKRMVALEQLKIWRDNFQPCVQRYRFVSQQALRFPPYVEATIHIMDAQQLDRSVLRSPSSSISSSVVAQAYSSAITRSVTELTKVSDGKNAKSREASTYRQRAKSVDLPEEAIDVRNQLAHGAALPTLNMLRWVASLLLQFIFEAAWKPRCDEIWKTSRAAAADGVAPSPQTEELEISWNESMDHNEDEVLSLAELRQGMAKMRKK